MAIVKKTKNGKTFYWDTVKKKFAKNPTSSTSKVKKVETSKTKPKTTSSSIKTTKLSKLSPNDIFKLSNSNNAEQYRYYGRVKMMNRFNELKGYGSFMYGSLDNPDSRDVFTDKDLNVILVKEFIDPSKRKNKK